MFRFGGFGFGCVPFSSHLPTPADELSEDASVAGSSAYVCSTTTSSSRLLILVTFGFIPEGHSPDLVNSNSLDLPRPPWTKKGQLAHIGVPRDI